MLNILSDQPTIDDGLGYKKAADTLARIIADKKTATPLTIGIFGEWGTGKTSLLQMIEYRVRGKNCATVWFDAWRYDENNTVWKALIQTILAKMDEDETKSAAFKEEVAKLALKFLAFVAAKTVEIGTAGVVKPIEIYGEAKEIIRPEFEKVRAWGGFDREFSRIVGTYVGEEGRLVVFIDDLDRCLPENAIQVLEAIKLFLAQQNCVFVLGVDKQVIERAISLRYEDDPQMTGVKYLEKIVQLPFFLPIPQPESIKVYIRKLVGQAGIQQEAQRVLNEGAGNNPRRIKRLINTFTLLHSMAPNISRESVLVKVVVIQLRFPNFYRFLCSNPDAIDNLAKLYDGEVTPESLDNSAYKSYLKEEPDLVDFLIRTRDIKPEHNLWDPYLRLTEMVNIQDHSH